MKLVHLLGIVISGLILMTNTPCYAEESTDSVSSENQLTVQDNDSIIIRDLGELVVEGQRDLISGDKTVFKPDNNAKSSSYNAVSLLYNMAIPMLSVSPDGDVKMANGQGVAIYIDFLPASSEDLAGLRPADVKSVDIYTNSADPRFQGAPYVINYVLVKYKYGGYTKLDVEQQFMETSGVYRLTSKLVKGKMTYSLAGQFGFLDEKHAGEDVTTTYNFPEETLTTISGTLDSHNKYHAGWARFGATYSAPNISLYNTILYFGSRTPGSLSTSKLEYIPAWYPKGISSTTKNGSNDAIVWDGFWYFGLPRAFSLNVVPKVSYNYNVNNTTFSNDGNEIANYGNEKSWMTSLNASLNKSFGRHNIRLEINGSTQGNHIGYEGTTPYRIVGRSHSVRAGLGANLAFSNLWAGIFAGTTYNYDRFGTERLGQWAPQFTMWLNYNISSHCSLGLDAVSGRTNVSLSNRNPELTMESLVMGVQGNPLLKQPYVNRVSLSYTYLFSDALSATLFGNWGGQKNPVTDIYNPILTDNHPVMVKHPVNEGSTTYLNYGVSITARLFRRSLVLSTNIMGLNERAHTFSPKRLDDIRVTANATYYYKRLHASLYWQRKVKGMEVWGIRSLPEHYDLSVGYGYNNLVVEFMAVNVFRSSWKVEDRHIWMPNYDSHAVKYEQGRHRMFKITASYSFGYGKTVERDNISDPDAILNSGLVN